MPEACPSQTLSRKTTLLSVVASAVVAFVLARHVTSRGEEITTVDPGEGLATLIGQGVGLGFVVWMLVYLSVLAAMSRRWKVLSFITIIGSAIIGTLTTG